MKISDHDCRERAFRQLAKHLYENQPSFMERGKNRFQATVSFDAAKNRVTWNGFALQETSCWKTTEPHHETKLGTIIVALMVKNESKIIERLLTSIIDHVDGFIIFDTGSTDQTKEIMWNFLVEKHNKRGAIYETSKFWDFSSCRTITVQLCYGRGDLMLLMDADYKLFVKENDWKSKLLPIDKSVAYQYMLETTGSLSYYRPHLVSAHTRWHYECRTHEFLSKAESVLSKAESDGQRIQRIVFHHLQIDHVADGGSKSDKEPRDVVLLLMDLMDSPDSERARFYLGNTLRSMGMLDWALRVYKEQQNLCKWNEELYCGADGMLDVLFRLNAPVERQLIILLHATYQTPERLEMLASQMRRIRVSPPSQNLSRYLPLYLSIASFYALNEYPKHHQLFVRRLEHDYGFWFEVAQFALLHPMYFEYGLFAVEKAFQYACNEESKKQKDQQESTPLTKGSLYLATELLYQKYQTKLEEIQDQGNLIDSKIRDRLMYQAHVLFSNHQFSAAFHTYEACLHPYLVREPSESHASDPTQKTKLIALCKLMKTPVYQKSNRLTTFRNAYVQTSTVQEDDMKKALCCYQMGKCVQAIYASEPLLSVSYFVDSLKFVPGYQPSMNVLYQLTSFASSSFTRLIFLLIRHVSGSPMQVAAQNETRKTLEPMLQQLKRDCSYFSTLERNPFSNLFFSLIRT